MGSYSQQEASYAFCIAAACGVESAPNSGHPFTTRASSLLDVVGTAPNRHGSA